MVKSLHTPSYAAFRQVMADARERQGLTQAELAHRLGKPQSFVSKYESGERRLDIVEFLSACSALELMPETLFQSVLCAIHEYQSSHQSSERTSE